MRKICDIRFFNEEKYHQIGNKENNIAKERLILKLREQNFSLSDQFDHLYISFTRNIKAGTIERQDENIDPYHKWYRFCLFGVDEADYQELENKSIAWFLEKIETILTTLYVHSEEEKKLIQKAIQEIQEQQENYQVIWKEKSNQTCEARIYLRISETGTYLPRLEVTTKEGNVLLNTDLPPTKDFAEFGEIRLTKRKVTIFPRKNVYAEYRKLQPLTFDY